MEVSLSTSSKFNGENWLLWKFETQVILKGRGLFNIVSGTKIKPKDGNEKECEEWVALDAKAQELIVSRMQYGPLAHIQSCETSDEMWTKLKSVYEKDSIVSVHLLQQKFFTIQFGSDSVSTFISNIEDIRVRLKQAGHPIDDKMVITKILMSLPEKYKHFRSAWESAPIEKQTLKELVPRLLLEEERAKAEDDVAVALIAQRRGNGSRALSECTVCGKSGHSKKDCYKTKQCDYCKKMGHPTKNCFFKKNKSKKKSHGVEQALIASGCNSPHDIWYMDSGCSQHMCRSREDMSEYKDLDYEHFVQLGDGTNIKALGMGSVRLQAYNGTEWQIVNLKSVLYVPDLNVNLFSATSTLDKGLQMVSDQNICKFIKNKEVIALARRDGRLFKMLFKNISTSRALSSQTDVQTSSNMCNNNDCEFMFFHKKLAHQNFAYIRKILLKNNVPFSCMKQHFCSACVEGKQCRTPAYSSLSKTSSRGEIVHADVCGPLEELSIGGSRYFLLLKDDYSRFRSVYFLKEKSQVISKIKIYLALCENEGKPVKILRTDNGGEFINAELKGLLESKGIKHQTSVPYTPAQNGKIEREMRTVMEAARTLMKASQVQNNLWAEAVNTAVYVINRTGVSSQENKTPYELFYQKQFDMSSLKCVFGSEVWAHIPKQRRRKLDSKSRRGLFVGYGETTKGYKIFYPESKTFSLEREIIISPHHEPMNLTEKVEQVATVNLDVTDLRAAASAVSSSLDTVNLEENATSSSDTSVSFTDAEDVPVDNSECRESDNMVQNEPSNNDSATSSVVDSVDTMILRPRVNLKPPIALQDYDTSYFTFLDSEEPTSLKEAKASPSASKWEEAMKMEMKALSDNETWTFIDKSEDGVLTVDSKWVFRLKRKENNEIAQYKARLVARGFMQTDVDFNEVYSPVVRLVSVRTLLSISCNNNWPVHQMDVCAAFLHGDIKENIYLKLPENFDVPPKKTCKLKKSLYGLRQAPRCWYDKFHNFIISQNFQKTCSDQCMYCFKNDNNTVYVLIFVDDILITGFGPVVQNIMNEMSKAFKMKYLGLVSSYLGIQIRHDVEKGFVSLNQTQYLKNILDKFNMSDCHGVSTPIDSNIDLSKLQKDKSEDNSIEYRCRQVIGCLMYAMLGTRPDLCLSITMLSRFQSCASQDLWVCLKRVLRYVKATIDLKLIYYRNKNSNVLIGYADADWGGNPIDRKSTSGYCFYVYGNLVAWFSKKQSTVALSSCEAEYVALAAAVSEACWLRSLLIEMFFSESLVVTMFEDNQSAIRSCNSLVQPKRMKHLDIKYHFIKERLSSGHIKICYVCSKEQVADILTKPLSAQVFKNARDLLFGC